MRIALTATTFPFYKKGKYIPTPARVCVIITIINGHKYSNVFGQSDYLLYLCSMETVVIGLWVQMNFNYDYYVTSNSSMSLTVLSRIDGVQYPDLYWCCSFSVGYRNKSLKFRAVNQSTGSKFKSTYKNEWNA